MGYSFTVIDEKVPKQYKIRPRNFGDPVQNHTFNMLKNIVLLMDYNDNLGDVYLVQIHPVNNQTVY